MTDLAKGGGVERKGVGPDVSVDGRGLMHRQRFSIVLEYLVYNHSIVGGIIKKYPKLTKLAAFKRKCFPTPNTRKKKHIVFHMYIFSDEQNCKKS